MVTTRGLITASLRKIGVLANEEAMEAVEAQNGLEELNRLLETWNLQRLQVYKTVEITATLTTSDGTYTIGPGGQINVPRPLHISDAYTRRAGLDYPIGIATQLQYNAVGLKSLPAPYATLLYYNLDYPQGTLFLWPVPSEANELHLFADYQLVGPTALGDTLAFPPGYVDALVYELGKRLAPEYGKTLSAEFLETWRETRRTLKLSNAVPVIADLDPRLTTPSTRDGGWIYHGGMAR